MQFCKEYNAATQDKVGTVIPVEITCFEVGSLSAFVLANDGPANVYASSWSHKSISKVGMLYSLQRINSVITLMLQDRSFTFILKTPPASVLLQKAAGVGKGSGTPNSVKVGQVTRAQLKVQL